MTEDAKTPKMTAGMRILLFASLAANLAVEGFSLSEEEMAAVNSLEKGFRFNDPGHFCPLAFSTQCPIWD